MANVAEARAALDRLLTLPHLAKEVRYYAKMALSHLHQTDMNVIYPGHPDAPGPFPQENDNAD
jgi:hypothetical protein